MTKTIFYYPDDLPLGEGRLRPRHLQPDPVRRGHPGVEHGHDQHHAQDEREGTQGQRTGNR